MAPLTNGKRYINVHEGTELPQFFIEAAPGVNRPFTIYELEPASVITRWRHCEAALRELVANVGANLIDTAKQDSTEREETTGQADGRDDHALDLYWHALNYRTAHTVHAEAIWVELESCVTRLTDKAYLAGEEHEREKCAAMADEYATLGGSNFCDWFKKLAAAIRARGGKP